MGSFQEACHDKIVPTQFYISPSCRISAGYISARYFVFRANSASSLQTVLPKHGMQSTTAD